MIIFTNWLLFASLLETSQCALESRRLFLFYSSQEFHDLIKMKIYLVIDWLHVNTTEWRRSKIMAAFWTNLMLKYCLFFSYYWATRAVITDISAIYSLSRQTSRLKWYMHCISCNLLLYFWLLSTDYWTLLFKKIDLDAIKDFEEKYMYKGSSEGLECIKTAYLKYKAGFLEALCSTIEDEILSN